MCHTCFKKKVSGFTLNLFSFPVFNFRGYRGFRNTDISTVQFSSVQFSCSVVSDSLRPHELQHARPCCPSPTPGVHPNSCPSNW